MSCRREFRPDYTYLHSYNAEEKAKILARQAIYQACFEKAEGRRLRGFNPALYPDSLASIAEAEEEVVEEGYEIVIDEIKEILLAPRFDFIPSNIRAKEQLSICKRMVKTMKRKVIILGAPSVGMSFLPPSSTPSLDSTRLDA